MNADNKPQGWIITGWIFTLVYIVIGLWQFNNGSGAFRVPVGLSAIVTAALFGTGAFLAGKGNLKAARICWIIGGILGLPLGLVMLIGGSKLGKLGQADAGPASAPIPETRPAAVPPSSGKPVPTDAGSSSSITLTSKPASGEIKCPACRHAFTPPRITLATQAVIARYGPNPVQCPKCRHIWSH